MERLTNIAGIVFALFVTLVFVGCAIEGRHVMESGLAAAVMWWATWQLSRNP